jgi:ribosomal protein L12E/L44/L45/RPP1/RPP2
METTMHNFIRNLVGVKMDQAVHDAVEALVQWAPKAATEAEVEAGLMAAFAATSPSKGGDDTHGC